MKILITGATGLIGKELIKELMLTGHSDINILTRSIEKAKRSLPYPVNFYRWDLDEN
jgi:uncharacterized protein YbjT (DUF2867 family)